MKPLLLRIWRWLPAWLQWRIARITMQKFLVGVIAVIVDGEGRILLFKHTYRREYPWALPSGWLKAWESAPRAVEREVREEAGFQIRALRPLIAETADDRPRVDLVFHCEYLGGEFRPSDEVSEARYFAPDALPAPLEPFQRRLITQVMALLHASREIH